MRKRTMVFWALICLCLCLSSCAQDEGVSSLTEYSADKAEEVLTAFISDFNKRDLSDCEYHIDLEKYVFPDDYTCDYWFDDTYTAASWSREGDTVEQLWYKGVLYTAIDDMGTLSYDSVSWENLHAQEFADGISKLVAELMNTVKSAEPTYSYTPANGGSYLLEIDYPLTVIGPNKLGIYPDISVEFNRDGAPVSMTFSWNVPNPGDDPELDKYIEIGSVDYYFNSEDFDYLSERTIWRFAYNHGLCEEAVDMDAQAEKRRWCEDLIDGIGFDTPEKIGVEQEKSEFEPPDIVSQCGLF